MLLTMELSVLEAEKSRNSGGDPGVVAAVRTDREQDMEGSPFIITCNCNFDHADACLAGEDQW